MNKAEIVKALSSVLPEDRILSDGKLLREHSVDRFLKYQDVFGVYTRPLPAALVKVKSTEEVSSLLRLCNDKGIAVIPRTGGSSIEGGLETLQEDTVVIDASDMNEIVGVDTYNMTVTAQCGVVLEYLENQLRKLGYTTGHSPQSKPLAQMGGLVATRSTGQFSTLYGGIEDMVVGLEMVLPDGHVAKIKNVPRRAAGPDIRHIAIGSEGALCFITEVTVKIFKFFPDSRRLYSWVLHDMDTGFKILRDVMVEGYKPSMARLYDYQDGEYYFSHFSEGKPVLIFMADGPEAITKATGEAIEQIVARYPTYKTVDAGFISAWYDKLNWDASNIAKERQEILATGNIGFTTEISANWSDIGVIYEKVVRRISEEIPDITMIGGHSSHSYMSGTNLYFMYYYNVVDCPPEQEIVKYHDPINAIIVEETLRHGGSMVHHHGVGKHRVRWMKEEYGSSYPVLKALKTVFDPKGIMNPGTLFPLD